MKIYDRETGRPTEAAAAFVARNWPPAGGGSESVLWESIPGDGSNRTFIRIRAGEESAMLVQGPDPAENRSYEKIGRHLWKLNRMGPEFLAADLEAGLFLIEDLGSVSLQDYVAGTDDIYARAMYEKVLGMLAELHQRGLDDFDPAWCFQTPRYDRNLILRRETGYFISAFLGDWLGRPGFPESLPGEFERLAWLALEGAEAVLMHRDFQSRNVMIKDGRPRLIDFQGARPGPPAYDLASMVLDPYTTLDEDMKAGLLDYYISRRRGGGRFDENSFVKTYPLLSACRLLQALGAYGNLSRNQGKTYFEAFIPGALGGLERVLSQPALDFMPGLRALVRDIIEELENRI